MIKILFVCHGNICRSTMAEFVYKDLVEKKGRSADFIINSAGTSTEELGNPIHHGTVAILQKYKIPYDSHRAVQMQKSDYDAYDYLIAMDSANVRNMLRITGGDPAHKISKLMSFANMDTDVADPWYTRNFEITYNDVLKACSSLLARLLNE